MYNHSLGYVRELIFISSPLPLSTLWRGGRGVRSLEFFDEDGYHLVPCPT